MNGEERASIVEAAQEQGLAVGAFLRMLGQEAAAREKRKENR